MASLFWPYYQPESANYQHFPSMLGAIVDLGIFLVFLVCFDRYSTGLKNRTHKNRNIFAICIAFIRCFAAEIKMEAF